MPVGLSVGSTLVCDSAWPVPGMSIPVGDVDCPGVVVGSVSWTMVPAREGWQLINMNKSSIQLEVTIFKHLAKRSVMALV